MARTRRATPIGTLRNGHPAHVFTPDDRRKAAAKTNAIRRARRAAANEEIFARGVAELVARDEARRLRKREKERRRREEKKRLAALPHRYEAAYRADVSAPAAPLAPARGAVDEGRPRPFDSGRYSS